jgi:alanine dehydrogenase
MSHVVELADLGWREAMRKDRALALGLNTHDGHLISEPVAQAHEMTAVKLEEVLA